MHGKRKLRTIEPTSARVPLLAGIQTVDERVPLHFLLGVIQKTACERERNVFRE
jgi:hypothetical protein